MDDASLLGEIEDVIRTMPPGNQWFSGSPEYIEWVGRAGAVMHAAGMGTQFEASVSMLHSRAGSRGVGEVQRLIHQARYGLRLRTVGPISSAIGAGAVFDYFDEVRQIIETASSDLLFVDPYLDAEFVSRYLPHVKAGVAIRLLRKV
jgi:hypothetical protein